MAISQSQQQLLDELVSRLRSGAGANLEAVVLFGSAAGEEFQPRHSDLNVLCLLKTVDAAALEGAAPAVAWWRGKKQPAPVFFGAAELVRSADVFAIELHDMYSRHRLLFGADPFATLAIPMDLHRIEVERELRTSLLRLRHRFLEAKGEKAVAALMADSISTFLTLFRHALIALGEPAVAHRRQALDRLAVVLAFDAAPLHAVLDFRDGKPLPAPAAQMFRGYLDSIARVTEEVDRRLA